MKEISFVIVFIIFMVPITLNADDYKKSDGFFDNNSSFFGNNNALTPLERDQNSFNRKRDNLFDDSNNYFSNDKEINTKKNNKEKKENIQNIFSPHNNHNNTEAVLGNKIISLGLVVNSINKKHFESVMGKFRTTVDNYDLDAGHIYINGFIDEDVEHIITPLIARGSMASFHFSAPKEFNISLSPTWIIQTSEGRILLEGVSNLNRYINKKGEFVENGVPMEQRFFDHEDNSDSFKGISIFGD